MKKTFTLLAFAALILASLSLKGQVQPAYVRQDTTIFEKTGGLPAEVYIRNSTKYRTGAAMMNQGNGLLYYRNVTDTVYRLNDSVLRVVVGGVNYDQSIKGRLYNWNYGTTFTSSQVTVTNAHGGSFVIGAADLTNAGLMTSAQLALLNAKLALVSTQYSISGNGAGSPIQLTNDVSNPGINKVYRTDLSGVRGWGDFPAGGGSNDWNDLINKPTTVAASGLTDALSFAGTQSASNKTLIAPVIQVGSDAQYDLWYRGATGLMTRLGIGSAGQQLTVAPGAAGYSWAAPPAANQTTLAALRANNSASTTIPYYITDLNQEGFFYYVTTVGDKTSENGGPTGAGTIVVAGTSAPYKQFKRYYSGESLNLFWFGGVDDYVYTTGLIGSGTNNVDALNRMFAAATGNEPMEIPYTSRGFYFAGSVNTWTYVKTMQLHQKGNIYINAAALTAPWLTIHGTGGAVKIHRWISHNARVIGRESNTPSHSGNNYGVNSPDYRTYTGTFVEFADLIQGDFNFKWIQGFGEGIAFNGGLIPTSGGQEVKVWFDRLEHNRIGISFRCPDGTGFLDKNYIMGGMINGDTAIKIDGGYDVALDKTCAFRSNTFNHLLIERCNTGIYMNIGDFTYNRFEILDFEGGSATGVFGPTKLYLTSTAGVNKIAIGTSFTGRGIWGASYIQDAGQNATFNGAQFNLPSPSFSNIGGMAISGFRNTDLLIMGTDSLNNNSKSVMPANWDHITFRGTKYPKTQALQTHIGGETKYVSYDGFTEQLTSATASPYTLKVPIKHLRVNRTTTLTLLVDVDDLIDGKGIFLDKISTGTIEVKRASDNVTLMATTVIGATTGFYYLVYNGATPAFEAKAFGGGGGSGGGVTAVAASGSGANADGGVVSGSLLTNYYATNLYPGLLSATTQTFGGDKTFAGSLTLRASTISAYALKWPATGVLMTAPPVGVEEFDGEYRYITTTATQHDKYLTENGDQVIAGNTVYNGAPITAPFMSFKCHRVTNTNITAASDDWSLIVYNQTANRDVIIPTAASAPNRIIWITQQDGNGFNLTLKDPGGGSVTWMGNDGSISNILLNNNMLCLHSDGTQWNAISQKL